MKTQAAPKAENRDVATSSSLSNKEKKALGDLFSPSSLAIMAGFIVAYIAAQLTPVGWVADANTKNHNEVRNKKDLEKYDKQNVMLFGCYHSIAAPRKGPPLEKAAKENVIIALNDETEVFLEASDSPFARRSHEEQLFFEGRNVVVIGTIHKIMPSKGAGLLAPCINNILSIRENNKD